MYNLRIRTKNLCGPKLRHCIKTPKKGVFRLGSLTPNSQIFTPKELDEGVIEINQVFAVERSANKHYFKRLATFDLENQEFRFPTAEWCTITDFEEKNTNTKWLENIFTNEHGVIVKHIYSSRGRGIYRFEKNQQEEFKVFTRSKYLQGVGGNYIIERYYTYSREYRLHVDKFGCFHANRKMLKTDATDRWHRHHSNTVWIREENKLFRKPNNWDEIVSACQRAREILKLDICSFDIKVQSTDDNPKFIILESNSGSALGDELVEKYKVELEKIAQDKFDNQKFSYE